MNAAQIKEKAYSLGVDLCGIASADRYTDAPAGFSPCDVLPGCRSVIVIARRFNHGTLKAASTIPYTVVRNDLSFKLNEDAWALADAMDRAGCIAVPMGAIGPDEYDKKTNKERGIISLKHSAVLAGLGKMGKNTLLVNDRFGNMLWLNAIMTTEKLEPDPIATYEPCPPNCRLCLDICPVHAMDGISIDQPLCRNHAFGEKDGGEWRIKCYECRKICPNRLGMRK